ncbi:hypothetical protein LCGC14_2373530 [marine sediment metagenome]|uniref:Uncharacterized protein n=1 Tax=marine sediment metagenome TaxID=412755 RepID=A0A0F9EXN4_9ZZZZ
MMEYLRNEEYRSALHWWSRWHHVAQKYAYRYMASEDRRSRYARRYRRLFDRARQHELDAHERCNILRAKGEEL